MVPLMATGKSEAMFWKQQSGFTYLAILFAIVIAGVALSTVGINWSQESQRARERELLFIGNQFRQAIMLYYERTPGSVKRYPTKLDDLLLDTRYSTTQHYLRKIYRDPITNSQQWGLLIAPEGGIMGVYSLSDKQPLKSSGFDYSNRVFEGAVSYSAWVFSYAPNDQRKVLVQ